MDNRFMIKDYVALFHSWGVVWNDEEDKLEYAGEQFSDIIEAVLMCKVRDYEIEHEGYISVRHARLTLRLLMANQVPA